MTFYGFIPDAYCVYLLFHDLIIWKCSYFQVRKGSGNMTSISRALHYVFKIGDRKASYEFYTKILYMKVRVQDADTVSRWKTWRIPFFDRNNVSLNWVTINHNAFFGVLIVGINSSCFKCKNVNDLNEIRILQVLRHEEFEEGCKATCNGPYDGKWSKTMIGYGPEDDHFVLELTYNYNIGEYRLGNDYRVGWMSFFKQSNF